jgi:hypothetical protein
MAKSLIETAKAILEGTIPSVSSSDSNPDRDAASSNPNMATLKPGSKSPEADPKHNEASDLGGNTPEKVADENLGAKAAVKGKDSSIKTSVAAEPAKKLAMAEELEEEEVQMSEELKSFIDDLIAEGKTEEEIMAAIDENFEVVEATVEEATEEEVAEQSAPEVVVDMQEHVDALFQGEELSEEFRQKATTIFEAAVKQKLDEKIAELEAIYEARLEEATAQIQESLSSDVDDYLNYVVEQWVSDNEVAIEAGLRTELTEDFISGLKSLFEEHYIDIPEEKVSVVEELGAKVEELEAKLNEEIEKSIEMSKIITESKRVEVFHNTCEGLTATQAEKLRSLSEGVEFSTVDEYAAKIKTLRENYFPTTSVKSTKSLDNVEDADGKSMISEELQGPMAHYVRALGRSLPK